MTPGGASGRGIRGHLPRPHLGSPELFMKILLFVGLVMVVLGIASLVVPIPRSETHGIKAGDVNIGVQTTHSERVSPILSAVLIAGGIACE
jgi:hypothetical protein